MRIPRIHARPPRINGSNVTRSNSHLLLSSLPGSKRRSELPTTRSNTTLWPGGPIDPEPFLPSGDGRSSIVDRGRVSERGEAVREADPTTDLLTARRTATGDVLLHVHCVWHSGPPLCPLAQPGAAGPHLLEGHGRDGSTHRPWRHGLWAGQASPTLLRRPCVAIIAIVVFVIAVIGVGRTPPDRASFPWRNELVANPLPGQAPHASFERLMVACSFGARRDPIAHCASIFEEMVNHSAVAAVNNHR